jgi:hypothetical protein
MRRSRPEDNVSECANPPQVPRGSQVPRLMANRIMRHAARMFASQTIAAVAEASNGSPSFTC